MPAPGSPLMPVTPVFLVDLFPQLHAELMSLLRSLRREDWGQPTACALWSVKDVVAHLLDSALRRLSFGRDRMEPVPDQAITSYGDLVGYLNRLNAEWVRAAERLSPQVLIDMLDLTEPALSDYFRTLDPSAPARFGVAWAGEEASPNWFDIGREYTERWLHQQQIREAVGATPLTSRKWLHPTLDIFIRALPFTYREVDSEVGRSLRIEIQGEAGGTWTLKRTPDGWRLFTGGEASPATRVTLSQDVAWKLFSKGLSPEQAKQTIKLEGDVRLGQPLLSALAIMA
jgi:uncharacterized protein (TIGR03083 family)